MTQIDDTLWQKILESLIRLGIFQNDIDEIKMAFFQFCWQQEDQEELRHLRLSCKQQNV